MWEFPFKGARAALMPTEAITPAWEFTFLNRRISALHIAKVTPVWDNVARILQYRDEALFRTYGAVKILQVDQWVFLPSVSVCFELLGFEGKALRSYLDSEPLPHGLSKTVREMKAHYKGITLEQRELRILVKYLIPFLTDPQLVKKVTSMREKAETFRADVVKRHALTLNLPENIRLPVINDNWKRQLLLG